MRPKDTLTPGHPGGLKIPALPANPFVGLRPFFENEGLLFFGRREQTIQLLQRLHTHHFIGVVGSSGCGKSSLIRAGLIPKLKAGFMVAERDAWYVAVMRPGEDPLRNLAAALLEAVYGKAGAEETERFVEDIRVACTKAFVERLQPALADSDKSLLLLVDQFEELFRFGLAGNNPTQRDAAADFVAAILGLAEQRELPVYVVITMRSDFIGECDNFFGLPEALNRSLYLVPKLTRGQRQLAIEAPINLFGATLTPRLLDRLLNDVGEQADQLPVLQHALLRTWENWKQNSEGSVDLPNYEAAGTIKNALCQDADQALEGMSSADVSITRQMFQALTDTDAQSRRVRRPARLSEIEAITGASRAKLLEIIERFRGADRAFLNLYGEPHEDLLIDITHESLIRQWLRLVEWIDDEAGCREMYRRIVDAAKRYQRRETQLWRNPDLQLAQQWRKRIEPNAGWARRYEPDFDFESALAFLEKSRKHQLYRRLGAAAISGLLLLSLILTGYYFQRQQAEMRTRMLVREKSLLGARLGILNGVEALTGGYTDDAIGKFSAAIAYNQDDPDAYFYRGNAYLQKGDKAQAQADFQKYLALDGTIEKKAKAKKFIEDIQTPPKPAEQLNNPESDFRCAALIEQMFDDDKGTRIAATTSLILGWKDYPPLVPLIVKKTESHASNKSGVINALVVLGRAEPKYLHEHKTEVARLIDKVEENGAQTKERADSVRQILQSPAPAGETTAQTGSKRPATRPNPAASPHPKQ